MKKILLIAAIIPTFCFGQGVRVNPVYFYVTYNGRTNTYDTTSNWQPKLVAGSGVTITGNDTISATGSGGTVTDVIGSTYIDIGGTSTIQPTVSLSATGTPSARKFLRGDNVWAAPLNSGTITITGGTGGSYSIDSATIPAGMVGCVISVTNTSNPTTPATNDPNIIYTYIISGTTLTVYLWHDNGGSPDALTDNYTVSYTVF